MLCVPAVTFQPVKPISLWLHSDLEAGVTSVCFLLGSESPGCDLQRSPAQRGSYASIVIPPGAKHRVQSPLERWPGTSSTDRPEMESRPYEFLPRSH